MKRQKSKSYTESDLLYSLEQAAAFLDAEEWPEDDGGAQVAANSEGAKRIRKMIARIQNKKPLQSKRKRQPTDQEIKERVAVIMENFNKSLK